MSLKHPHPTARCLDCAGPVASRSGGNGVRASKRCRPCAGEHRGETYDPTPDERERMSTAAKVRQARARGRDITADDIATIKRRRAAGESGTVIGLEYGLSSSTVSVIVRYGSWSAYKARVIPTQNDGET